MNSPFCQYVIFLLSTIIFLSGINVSDINIATYFLLISVSVLFLFPSFYFQFIYIIMVKVRFCNNIWLGLGLFFLILQQSQLLIDVFRPLLCSVSIGRAGFRCAILLLVFLVALFPPVKSSDSLNIFCPYIFIYSLPFYYISLYNFYSWCFRSTIHIPNCPQCV